jgi:N-acetylglutamate synthase-like GNAT family acetyltransferase
MLLGCIDNDYLIGVIATNLFQTVEERCKRQNNISKITVNSSLYAIEFYHRLGFADTDKEQIVNGIRFTSMAYLLK